MDLANKNIMVIGLGKSGAGLIDFLNKKAKGVIAFDANESVRELYQNAEYSGVEFHIGCNPSGEEMVDLVVISPGVPLDLPFVQRFERRGIPIMGEVELAYRLSNGRFIGITGTNGKTTTTALTGEIFKNAGLDTRVVGNIGNPIISEIKGSGRQTVFVAELSSFQLETIDRLRCRSAVIINLTPDHLNRHKTMGNYIAAKQRIFKNQTTEDFAVINLDDPYFEELENCTQAQKIFISVNKNLKNEAFGRALFIQDRKIIYAFDRKTECIIDLDKVFLKGKHNYENILAASALAISFDIPLEVIAKTLECFKGVEHRLEFVKELKGIRYYNDSKGTNPDASIKAIEALEKNIILIAGGMDKKSDFDELVKLFPGRVKHTILLGETKRIIADALEKHDYHTYTFAQNMDDAVAAACRLADAGDQVLLSPACASWDMYSCFEERGAHFKSLVNRLEVENVR